jgi:lipopolysaccharide transport system permease protein
MVRQHWQHRELIRQLVGREVTQRYQGSVLGMLWSFVTPLLMLAIYTFVFSTVFKSKWRASTGDVELGEFALQLFAGLTAFNVFGEVLTRAPGAVLNCPNYVKKVVFPVQILPVVVLGGAVVNSLICVGIMLVANAALFHTVSVTLYLLPLAYLPLILLSLGVGWFLASLGVYIRDIGLVVNIVAQMLLFLSPVFYAETALPAAYRPLMLFNPLAVVLNSFRQTILDGAYIDWSRWGLWTGVAAFVAWAGYVWFMKTKKGFADVI